MDIVDIDKVLDDFELNEDRKSRTSIRCNTANEAQISVTEPSGSTEKQQQNVPADKEAATNKSFIKEFAGSSNSVSNKSNFVNVSNVFMSLNEYVNAGIVAGESVNLSNNQQAVASQHRMEAPSIPDSSDLHRDNNRTIHSSSTVESTNSTLVDFFQQSISAGCAECLTDSTSSSNDIADDQYSGEAVKLLNDNANDNILIGLDKNEREEEGNIVYNDALTSSMELRTGTASLLRQDSSTSTSSSRSTHSISPASSSLSSATSHDFGDKDKLSNQCDLTNDQTKPVTSISLDESVSMIANITVDSHTSSTSSPLPSTGLLSSNNVLSINQSSSTITTLPILSTTSNELQNDDSTEVIFPTEPQLDLNEQRLNVDEPNQSVPDEISAPSVHDSSLLKIDKLIDNEVYVNEQVPDPDSNKFIKPLCFEAAATMDDVSDTELESYLQELEDLEEPSIAYSSANERKPSAIALSGDGEPKDVGYGDNALAGVKDDKNSDSFSQASTVEFADVGPETDFDPTSNIISTRHSHGNNWQSLDVNHVESSNDASQLSASHHCMVDQKHLNKNDDDGENNDDEIQTDDNANSSILVTSQQSNSHPRPSTLALSPSYIEPIVNTAAGSTPANSNVNDRASSEQPEECSLTSGDLPDEQTTETIGTTSLTTTAPPLDQTQPLPLPPSTDNQQSHKAETVPGYNLSINELGKVQPYWIPDSETTFCMRCNMKFSFIKRRHHCRACGQVLCSACCSLKAKLEYMGDAEARVCKQCDILLNNLSNDNTINADGEQDGSITGIDVASAIDVNPDGISGSASNASRTPNPNNPMEYCSTIPPHQQVGGAASSSSPISVMVPVGVLKRDGVSLKPPRKDKNVMFSDGIRPGCDLTDLDNNWGESSGSDGGSNGYRKAGNRRVQTPPGPTSSQEQHLPKKASKKSTMNKFKYPPIDEKTNSFIPAPQSTHKDPKIDTTLPPISTSISRTEFRFSEVENNEHLFERLQNEQLKFIIQRNFYVLVKIIKLSCCINKTVINFTTQGMHHVGQDEIVILLEVDESNRLPKDIFIHLNEILRDAEKGHTITELGFSIANSSNFLGSKEHSGFLYIRTTFQCMQNVHVPENPYLIGILIHRWEVPWAKIFPLRLMLRLGALYRYYPSPHVSVRGRNSVYAEIAQTIINFLADFRAYSYTIATIRGMFIHMEDRRTNVLIPRNRYDQIMKALNHSSEHILALAGNFSKLADGHLVCVQNTESGCAETHAYSTQAINIQGKPRKVTGASFLVLNGALKTSSGLSGKCSIVEDGLMVQILPKKMTAIQQALKTMKNIDIVCGPIDADVSQTEVVSIQWVDNDTEFNVGVVSCIDRKPMDGVPSILVHHGLELLNSNHILRWTEVFIIKSDEESAHGKDPIDMSKLSEHIAKSVCMALVSFLDLLAANGLLKLAIRATLDPDHVCYEAGSNYEKLAPLYMNALDNELVPTLHRQASHLQVEQPITIELVFHILDE